MHSSRCIARFFSLTACCFVVRHDGVPDRAATGASVRTGLIDGRVVLDVEYLTTLKERAEAMAQQQIARTGLTVPSKWPPTL